MGAAGLADRILVMGARPGRILTEIPVRILRAERSEAALADLRKTLKSLLLKETPE